MSKGFTLLELLIVCACIGLLLGVGGVLFTGAINRSRLAEASAQLVGDLQRARSAAQRYNQNAELEVRATTASAYTLTINGRSTERRLPAGTQLRTPSPTAIRYHAPFGETSGTNVTLTVELQRGRAQPRYVRVIGVTGKVYTGVGP
ncbi:pilus assembly FimT family protein [Truepera radiovictrix]|uniref:Pilus assembly protein n=1 Tax=Truepera radiovictrix (strain DSM 17093 / CIP 108686 / LMG 22925 / RQ-24) TaxID=649638 RepID=D7CWN4_TRURR|nr:prepilin-type N-terminal cleavage/methylation domain-containing protein [Truepera radiovictrix]ADI14433.1 putative pilus assembly protein [Truepera radiovictrix DSM 17093]WMT57010.1 prepilin-type N-terminal cleavage/methylation domain-containing protein [Truepera radiovictrix]